MNKSIIIGDGVGFNFQNRKWSGRVINIINDGTKYFEISNVEPSSDWEKLYNKDTKCAVSNFNIKSLNGMTL